MTALRTLPILQALAAAALFGTSTPFAKRLVGTIDPWLLAGLLYLGSGGCLAAFRLLRPGRASSEAPLRAADVPWLVAAIAAGGIVGPVLLMYGLARTDAGSAALLLNVEGIATMAIAWVAFREPVDRRLLLGAAAIVAGAIALAWSGSGLELRSGAAAVVAAGVAWGLDNNLTRRISDADPVVIAMLKGLAAGTVNLTLALLAGAAWPGTASLVRALLVGALGYGASLVLFILALRGLGTARAGAYFSTAPFVGASVATVLFGAPVTTQLVVAALLMVLGVYLHVSEQHAHEHEHEPLAHSHRHAHDEHHRHEHEHGSDPGAEPHVHAHRHAGLRHAHPHYPDTHHRHSH